MMSKINFSSPMFVKSDEELIAIVNLERHNGDIKQYVSGAYEELRRRGKTPVKSGYTEGAPVYTLPEEAK